MCTLRCYRHSTFDSNTHATTSNRSRWSHLPYDPVGNTTVITQGSAGGAIQVETRGYDARSEVVSDTIGGPGVSGQTTSTTYDADGNVTQTTAPSGDVTANTDDLADETTGVSIVSAGGTSSRQKTYSYDGAGNQYDVVDFDGHDHRTSFDGANRAVLSTDSIAGTPSITTSASFDPDGNVIGRTAQTVVSGGQVQTHTYSATVNGQDWLTSTSDDGQTTNNGYDAAGMQHTQTVFNGTTPVTSTLNAEGLATALTENAGGGTPYTSTFSY